MQETIEGILGKKAFSSGAVSLEGLASDIFEARPLVDESRERDKRGFCVLKRREQVRPEGFVDIVEGVSLLEGDPMSTVTDRDRLLEIGSAYKILHEAQAVFQSGDVHKMSKFFFDPDDAMQLTLCSMGRLVTKISPQRRFFFLRSGR